MLTTNNWSELFKEFYQTEQQVKKLKGQFQLFIQDITIPLNERWFLYITAPSFMLNDNRGFYEFDAPLSQVDLTDDLYWYRYETIPGRELYSRLIESIEFSNLPEMSRDDIKEIFLKHAYGNLTYDW